VTGQSRNATGELWANRREFVTFWFYTVDGRKRMTRTEAGQC
jgi:hypothetical protein